MKTAKLALSLSTFLGACHAGALPPGSSGDLGTVARSACGLDDASGAPTVVLIFPAGPTVQAVHSDGNAAPVYDFRGDGFTGGAYVGTSGGFALASSYEEARTELVLLDLRTEPRTVWRRTIGNGGGLVAADGTVYLYGDGDGETTTVVPLQGEETHFRGYPSQVMPSGALLVHSPDTNEYAWWRPGQAKPQPISPQPSGFDAPIVAEGDTIGYLARTHGEGDGEDGRTVVATSSPDGSVVVAVPAAADDAYGLAGSGRYLLLTDYTTNTDYRFDTRGRAVDRIDRRYPAGFSDDTINEVRELSPEGDLLVGLRNDYLGGLYQGSGDTWTRISGSFAGVQGIGLQARAAGTYVMRTGDDRFVLVPWSPAPADDEPQVRGPEVQIFRPATGVRVSLAGALDTAVTLTGDGACAAFVDPVRPDVISVLDLRDGSRKSVASPVPFEPSTLVSSWIER